MSSLGVGLQTGVCLGNRTPGLGPSLNLDFVSMASSGVLDPRITFTRSSSATRVNSSGLIELVSNDIPRFEYDPVTLEPLGLLLEEQRTNFVLFNVGYTISASFAQSFPEVYPFGIDPRGVLDSSLMSTAGGSDQGGRRSPNAATNTTYTASIFVKQGGASPARYAYLRLIIAGIIGSPSEDLVVFDLQTGTVGSTVGSLVSTPIIQAHGNGWYRISATCTTPASIANNLLDIKFGDVDSTAMTVAAGRTMEVWGAQLEIGTQASSYIPTGASTVTRSADFANITGSNFSTIFNPSEFSIAINFTAKIVSSFYGIVGIGTNPVTAQNWFTYGRLGNNLRVDDVTASSRWLDNYAMTSTLENTKTAWAYKNGEPVKGYTNGVGYPASPVGQPFSVGVSQMLIGNEAEQTRKMIGVIKTLKLYKSKLENDELQALTL